MLLERSYFYEAFHFFFKFIWMVTFHLELELCVLYFTFHLELEMTTSILYAQIVEHKMTILILHAQPSSKYLVVVE